jgi:predicted Zn-dependent protease
MPPFDEDKPVLEVRFPDLLKRPNEVERDERTGLARQICADIDSQLNLESVTAELDRMGFEKGPEHGFVREAQYSRGKIKLTFEGA